MTRKTRIIFSLSLIVLSLSAILSVVIRKISNDSHKMNEQEIAVEETLQYGIPINGYRLVGDVVQSGESLSVILGRYGVSAQTIDSLVGISKGVFDLRSIRPGQCFTAFLSMDTVQQKLCHFVYENSFVDYVVFSFADSLSIKNESKDVRRERVTAEVTINSSLWNAMTERNLSPKLAMDLSDIYAWSIDFFGLQKGDNFKVIYEESFVDTLSIGTTAILGAWFENGSKRYYAIPYGEDKTGKPLYWDEAGNSLRKTVLKAPLKFSRISSKFSNSRLHPVLKIRRPHHGVDYAAPAGTPVVAVASGTIIAKGYSGGGGNTVKIRHSSGKMVSGYLHLRGYAPGIAVGKHVEQGQVIGYVGSTGLSTGAHLDFRMWINNVATDPLKVPSEPVKPIDKEDRAHFEAVKSMVMGSLEGKIAPDSIITVSKKIG